jgi:hypothetical protein
MHLKIEARVCEFIGGPLCGQCRLIRIPLDRLATVTVPICRDGRGWKVCDHPDVCEALHGAYRYIVISHDPAGAELFIDWDGRNSRSK